MKILHFRHILSMVLPPQKKAPQVNPVAPCLAVQNMCLDGLVIQVLGMIGLGKEEPAFKQQADVLHGECQQ